MNHSKNYDKGKENERDSWNVLREKGYVRPTSKQRKNVLNAFKAIGKTIKTRGYDLIRADISHKLESAIGAIEAVHDIILYELKTAGASRKTPLKENFRGLGFTLSGSEKQNAEELGEQYKFVFLDLATEDFKISKLEDWFTPEISRIYPTYSIFIK
tara:strand:+ start:325 stop:795 length:471 start_codon:yes stop_codon:yes gene_type:complete